MAEAIDEAPPETTEQRRFELHSLWRVLFWGASAAMAVALVTGTAFSDLGAERLRQTVASLIETGKVSPQAEAQQTRAIPQVDIQQFAALEKQAQELAQTVRELTTERDRVKARLATIEQNFDDITGAIKKQTAQSAQIVARLAQTEQKQAAAPPVISAPQTVAAIPSPNAGAAAPPPDTPITTAVTASPAADASPPLDGPIPLPPMRTAALEGSSPAIVRELGVDVGGATSLDALRANWATLKTNAGPDVADLAPSFIVRQKQSGGTDYRLVLGPLPNTAAALRLCAKLIAAKINCRAGTYTVERLSEHQQQPATRAVERQQPAPRPVEQLPTPARDSILLR